jgi:tetratricopeptide (TPR) repeat protein
MALALLLAGTAWARDPLSPQATAALARRHFARGAAYYQAGDFAQAQIEFQESYRLSGHPDMLFNLAAVAERLGRPAEAIAYLQRYLKERPEDPEREKIAARIERLRGQIKEPERPPEPPQPAVRQAPLSRPQPLGPLLPPAPPERRMKLWPGLALSGGGLVLLLTGAGLGGAALSAERQMEALPDGARFDMALDRRGRALSTAAIVLDVIGVAALAGGAVWSGVWLYRRRESPGRVTIAGAVTGHGLILSGSF